MEAASDICDMSDLQTIGASEIANNVSVAFLSSFGSSSPYAEPVQFAVTASASSSHRRTRRSKVHVSLKIDKGRGTLQIDTGSRKLSKQQMKQIHQIIRDEELPTKGGKKTKQEEVENFIEKYKDSHNYNDVPVATMRHIIPLFLMEIYPHEYGQFSRKVKGMWGRKPADWPQDVPFVDPNNKIKEHGDTGSKPTKELLVPMLIHLIRKYRTTKENATCRLRFSRRSDQLLSNGSVDLDEEPLLKLQESCADELEESKYGSELTEWNRSTSDPSTRTMFDDIYLSLTSDEFSSTPQHHSRSSAYDRHCQLSSETAEAVAGIPDLPSNTSYSSFGTADLYGSGHSSVRSQLAQVSDLRHSSNKSSFVSCPGSAPYDGSTPYQVEDDGEQKFNWNPVTDVIERIRSKIKFLTKSKVVAESDLGLLLTVQEMLERSLDETCEDKVPLIEKAHVVESVIDVIKLSGHLSVEWKQKLDDYQATSAKEQFLEADDFGIILLSSNTDPVIMDHQYLPQASAEYLVSQLNIEKRPAVGDSLLATTDILQVRPDVTGSLENRVPEDSKTGKSDVDNGAAYPSEHWQAGLQETAGASIEEQAVADETMEIELNVFDSSTHSASLPVFASLPVLDARMVDHQFKVIHDSQSWENNDKHGIFVLQPSPIEDLIGGLLPSATCLSTLVPATLSYQLPGVTFGLPCTADSSAENAVSHFSLPAAAAEPVSATTAWKSLPTVSDLVQNGLEAVHSVEQGSGHLPVTVSTSSSVWSASTPTSSSSASCGSAMQLPSWTNKHTLSLPTLPSKQVDVAQMSVSATLQQKSSVSHLQVVNTGPHITSPLPMLLPSARSVSLAEQTAHSVRSSMGQITGTMGDLTLDNDRHPLLRGMLTEASRQSGASDQTTHQRSAEDWVASVGKRSAPIPVMVEEVDFEDGSFSGPSVKKVRPSDADC